MANIPDLPREIINKLINLGGVERQMMCEKCGLYSTHVSVSFSERGAFFGSDMFSKFIGRIIDITPGFPLVFGNPYACTKCGRVRYEGGLLNVIE